MKKQGKKRLTIEDRMIIQACLHDNQNLAQIATRLNVSKSTIYREISKFSYAKPGYKCSCDKKSGSIYAIGVNTLDLARKRKDFIVPKSPKKIA